MSSSSSISLLFRAINHHPNFHSKYVVARFSSSIISSDHKGGSQDDPNRASGAPNRSDTDEPREKAGAAAVVDAGLKLGEKAKKTMDGLWDAAKETAESVRDDSNVNEDHYGRQGKLRPPDHDLRRKAGGYDFKDN